MTRIAVIGGGRIGEALIAGLIEGGMPAGHVVLSEKYPARADAVAAQFGIRSTSVTDAIEGADVIVVAVKPDDVDSVITQMSKAELNGEREQIIVSMAAGVPASRYEPKLPAGIPIVRVMPNTPMLVGEAMSVLAPGRHARSEHIETVRKLLGTVGKTAVVSETKIDAVTAVSGSGPAYFFLMAEAMIDAAVGLGLPRDTATTLVVQTMVGSAAMLDRSDESPQELRAGVTSPGGTTAAAIAELERKGFRAALLDAIDAAKSRSTALGSTTE
ncbi:pyrroline-5-carboxylate reductase [Rhodococcus sp. MEB064]|uniref:pyrroline-5-carboxylate reductase n=1 Tax=Rhodococcus sp. MEB064 TaxID=1587522 RepID=UPI0005AC7D49|nr:pyrroline-5-carboxylate reductase [Rhodococcus sp. MEB064]KIQ07772.1 pyrroline-5-carboxylate reductase [Rhodococcus sp. MEB064]